MESHKIALLAGVSILVGGNAAEAAVVPAQLQGFEVTAVTSTSGGNTNNQNEDGQALFFDAFDQSLGTLDSVRFTLHSAYALFAAVSASGEGNTNASATGDFNFLIDSEAFDRPYGPFQVVASCDSESSVCEGTQSLPNTDLDDEVVFLPADGAAFSLFLSPGTIGFLFENSGNLAQLVNPGTSAESEATGNWRGTLSIEYTYTPDETQPGGDVPEPASAGLLGLGALALGAAARRRRD